MALIHGCGRSQFSWEVGNQLAMEYTGKLILVSLQIPKILQIQILKNRELQQLVSMMEEVINILQEISIID